MENIQRENIKKKINVEETIARVTLPPESQELLNAGDLVGALAPRLFPSGADMQRVANLTDQLTEFQKALLLAGLRHAVSSVHDARVVFGEIACDYHVDGVGLELKDDSITLRDQENIINDLLGPLRVVYTTRS